MYYNSHHNIVVFSLATCMCDKSDNKELRKNQKETEKPKNINLKTNEAM